MKTVFFDVDTQIDFLFPAGALYVPGAESIISRVAELNRHAAASGIPLVADMDAHSEDDPEFKFWPPHCVVGTTGQQKPASTRPGSEIVFEKQTLSCFEAPGIDDLLRRLGAERFIVYGVVTEICVRHAALGLLKTGARVELVTDAVRALDESKAAEFFREFTSAGGVLTSTETVLRGGR